MTPHASIASPISLNDHHCTGIINNLYPSVVSIKSMPRMSKFQEFQIFEMRGFSNTN